jgi:hypothetical protein
LEENSGDEAAFADLEDTTGEDDDEPKLELNDDDKLDPSVEASDNAMVDAVIAEISEGDEASIGLPPLTPAQVNLGRFAITKVGTGIYIFRTNH